MPEVDEAPNPPKPTVFLSYASEDREAARLIGEALPAHGIEVWFDESELGGGDAWDQKIRRQIRECDYFMALVSAQTEARHEGYFRREWRLAVERTLDMADDHLFLLPVVIDDTAETHARVPEKFLAVQWLKLPGGRPNAALDALCHRLVSGNAVPPPAANRPTSRPIVSAPQTPQRPFPKEEDGAPVRFWFEVVAWAFWSVWALFKRWPRWVRVLVYIWLVIWATHQLNSSSDHSDSTRLSSSEEKKLKQIAQQYQGVGEKADPVKLAAQIAHEFSDDDNASPSNRPAILAIPFATLKDDAAARAVADAAFAQVYGRMAIAHHGKVGLGSEQLPACPLETILTRARQSQSAYVVCGSVDSQEPAQTLNIKIANVADGSVLWSAAYPVANADPEKIATEVTSKVPTLDED